MDSRFPCPRCVPNGDPFEAFLANWHLLVNVDSGPCDAGYPMTRGGRNSGTRQQPGMHLAAVGPHHSSFGSGMYWSCARMGFDTTHVSSLGTVHDPLLCSGGQACCMQDAGHVICGYPAGCGEAVDVSDARLGLVLPPQTAEHLRGYQNSVLKIRKSFCFSCYVSPTYSTRPCRLVPQLFMAWPC
jgi:hypothetical protein